MLNFLWAFMILTGIVYAAFAGTLPEITEAALDSAKEAVALCITMAGVLAFWVGLMRIAERAGAMRWAAKKIYPLIHFLFPRLQPQDAACQSISANCIANFFGLGWAATPAGLQAMKDLDEMEQNRLLLRTLPDAGTGKYDFVSDKIRHGKSGRTIKIASTEMCAFLVLNISSLQLIPVSVIAYRSQYGSVNPAGITGIAIIATGISTAAAVIFIRIMNRIDRRRGY